MVISAGDLVAVRLPPGRRWLRVLELVAASGAALLPLDPRARPAELRALLDAGRPTVVVGAAGWRRRRNGVPADPGTGPRPMNVNPQFCQRFQTGFAGCPSPGTGGTGGTGNFGNGNPNPNPNAGG
jgi:acyl-CoA synthetase (AMP-forming)/AMP-acid ligase II